MSSVLKKADKLNPSLSLSLVRYRKVLKALDWLLKCSYCFDIWQAIRQQCCWGACQISQRSDNSKYKSCGFKTYDKTSYQILKQGPDNLAIVSWVQTYRSLFPDKHQDYGMDK